GEDATRVADRYIVVEADVRGVLDLEPAHVPRRQVVVDAHVMRLPDVDAGVVRPRGDAERDAPAAAMGREDAVLGVVMRLAALHTPIVDAEEKDPLSVEAVHGEPAHVRAAQALRGIAQAGGAVGPLPGERQPLILTAGILEHDWLDAERGGDRDIVLVDDDGAGVR